MLYKLLFFFFFLKKRKKEKKKRMSFDIYACLVVLLGLGWGGGMSTCPLTLTVVQCCTRPDF